MAFLNEHLEMLLERIAAGPGDRDHIANSDTAMGFGMVKDLKCQVGHGREQQLLALNHGRQAQHLVLECFQEEYQPWLPVRRICADGALGLSEGEIIAFFALLDHAFQR